MASEVSLLVTLGVLLTPFLLTLMFVPTFLEWKRPKDAGPRVIVSAAVLAMPKMVDIEEPYELDVLLVPLIDDALSCLPRLD
ncbi:MAG: hypothetical protein NWF04_10215 [Candidatus Bathyarchaeota archaeon]|nr:hypothetical protein [Candidatus Bathyarchaeota archaeon]